MNDESREEDDAWPVRCRSGASGRAGQYQQQAEATENHATHARYNPNIFVVMVSAQEDIDTAVATLKHGAFDYIRKNHNLEANVKSVLYKIEDIKELLKARKPSFLKSIFKYF